MKKSSFLSASLIILLLAASCAGSGSSEQSTEQNSKEQSAHQKREAPERRGWDKGALYGDVESISVTTYKLTEKSGEIVKDEITDNYSFKFNQNGDIAERAYYNEDGLLVQYVKYDSLVNCIESFACNSDGSFEWKNSFKYDSQGRLIEETKYNSDGSLADRKSVV